MLTKIRAATDTLFELFIYYIILLLISAILFSYLEGRTLVESFYWSAVTATTIGYGDISPSSVGGRLLAIAVANISIFVLAPLIVVRMVDRINENRDHFSHEEQEQIKKSLEEIKKMLEDKT